MMAEGRAGVGSFLSKGACSITLGKNEVSLMREARSFSSAGGKFRGRGHRATYRGGRGSYRSSYQAYGGAQSSASLESALASLLQRGGGGQPQARGGSSKVLRCFKCNESSHLAKQCPNQDTVSSNVGTNLEICLDQIQHIKRFFFIIELLNMAVDGFKYGR